MSPEVSKTIMSPRENILVVDDKPDNLRLLSNILIAEGYKVRKVLNGRLALDAAKLDPPDLILLDIMMPDPDGYQVCQSLKANSTTQEIPIIFLSALNTVADKVKAFTMGGVDYITKPFQQEEVLARVKTHLQIRQLNVSLHEQNLRLAEEVQHRQQVEAELTKTLQELRETQAQMVMKEKLASLGALMAGIAHELRNPLNFVNNYAEGSIELLDELAADLQTHLQTHPDSVESAALGEFQDLLDEIRGNAQAIHQHGKRAEQVIANMMQHVRADHSGLQSFELNGLVQEAISLSYHNCRTQFSNLEVAVQVDYDATIPPIQGSSGDLIRAFINLLDNAFYALSQQKLQAGESFVPRLQISTQNCGNHVLITVRDNGIGVPSDIQAKIFDPFFTTKANDGTGLGLSISYDVIVGQHGGALVMHSEPGDFTEFAITLPI
jgi:signal transduction histidine kinase